MTTLLTIREAMRSFYSKYGMFVRPVIRFCLCFATFYLLSKNIGFYQRLSSMAVVFGLSLICAFLPYGACALLAGIVLLLDISRVSLELALIVLACLIVVMVLYYGFQPGDSYLLLLTPLFYYFNIPYAIPILVGLSGSIVSAVPVACGTFLFYIIQYVRQNAGILTSDESLETLERYAQVIQSILLNKVMILMIVSCIIGVIVVYLIRKLSIDYSWIIAIVCGALSQLAVIFIGDFMFNVTIPIVQMIAGIIFSVILSVVYCFFVMLVDYSRTEYTQFEDDDYYYYVKAVPKLTISATNVKVQKINNSRTRRSFKDDED